MGYRKRSALSHGVRRVLFGHYGLGAAMSAQLVLNAMLAPLGAMVLACFLKTLHDARREFSQAPVSR